MIKTSTILSRFTSSFGPAVASKKAPFIVGTLKPLAGLTVQKKEVVEKLIIKNSPKSSLSEIPTQMLLPEFEFDSGTELAFWPESILTDGLHVLDNKPFSRILTEYWPNEVMPILFSREGFTVILAPHVIDNTQKSQWVENKKQLKKFDLKPQDVNWLRQIKDTTFWVVVDGVEEYIRCRVCNFTLLKLDYISYRKWKHEWCSCSCFTYDDFCGCMRMRDRLINEKMQRDLSFRKRITKRQQS